MKKNLKKSGKSTKVTYTRRATGDNYKYVMIGAIVLLSIIAPYIHMFFDKTSNKEIFGFTKMRDFLYAIGVPSSLLTCSMLLMYTLSLISDKKKQKYLMVVAVLFLFNSFFQFIWIFWSGSDLSNEAYYFSVIGLSILFTSVYFLIYQHYLYNLSKLKFAFNDLLALLIRIKETHHPVVLDKAVYADKYGEPLKTNKSLEEETNEFHEDVVQTIKPYTK